MCNAMNDADNAHSCKSSCDDGDAIPLVCLRHDSHVCNLTTPTPLPPMNAALYETDHKTATTVAQQRLSTTPFTSLRSSSVTIASTASGQHTHPLHLCHPIAEDGDNGCGGHPIRRGSSGSHASMLATSTEDDIHSPLMPESVPVPSRCYDDGDDAVTTRNWSPGEPLRVAYVTWNMANNTASMEQVRTYCIKPNAHLIVVATQENGPFVGSHKMQRRWLKAVQHECLAQRYDLVGKHAMSALHIAVFARSRDVAEHVSHVHCGHVATGSLHHLLGNKGAVAVALALSLEPCVTAQCASLQPPSPPPPPTGSPMRFAPLATGVPARAMSDAVYSPLEHSLRVCNPLSPDCIAAGQSCPHQASLTARSTVTTTPVPTSTPRRASAAPRPHPGHKAYTLCCSCCCTILCINAHLPAHQRAVRLRNAGYRRIVRHLEVGLRGPHRRLFLRLLHPHAGRRRSGGDGGVRRRSTTSLGRCPVQGHEDTAVGGSVSGAHLRRTGGESGGRHGGRQQGSRSPGGLLSPEVSLLNLRSMFRPQRAVQAYVDVHDDDADDVRHQQRDVTEQFDLTLFGGDLNYRINGVRSAIEATIRLYPHVREILLRNDQLLLEQVKQTAFHGFHEGKLAFRPTYKYEVDPVSRVTQNIYSLSDKKNRLPAYCDRVLFKTRRNSAVRRVGIRLYTDVPNVRSSDHRPVVAIFDIQTRSGTGTTEHAA